MSEQKTFDLLKPEQNGTLKFGFRTSPDITAIAEAMVSAQAEFGAAIKDSANPAYRSKYADLSACIEATQKALNKYGIAVMQAPQLDGQMVTITTRLQHKSGQWYESDLSLPAVMRDQFTAQSVGSAITYARRYSLQAVLNLATTDDDGNSASGIGKDAVDREVERQKKGKAFKDEPKPDRLFFVLPEAHNGFSAELINVKQFGEGLNEVAAEGLRAILKKYVRTNKAGDLLVSTGEKLEALTAELASVGVPLEELKAARS